MARSIDEWEADLGVRLPEPLRATLLAADAEGIWPLDVGLARLEQPSDAAADLPFAEAALAAVARDATTDPSAVLYDPDGDPPPLRGVIPVADAGDGLLFVVIARGPRAGEVWIAGEAWAPVLGGDGRPADLATWLRERDAPEPVVELPKALRRALDKPEGTKSLSLTDWYAPTIPDVFAPLVDLESLSISGNRARALPPSIRRLGRLRKLWLTSMGSLVDIDAVVDLPKLEFLNVSRSPSVRLPEAIGSCAALKELVAMFTELRELPESLGEAPRLRRLSLRQSYDLDMRQAWPVIARMPALEVLDLGESQLPSWPDDVARPPGLKQIDLTDTDLPDAVRERLGE